MASYPIPPDTTIPSIANSTCHAEIFGMLCSNWSSTRISAFVKATYAEIISATDIEAYRQELPKELFLPSGTLRDKLKQLDVEIDAVGQMSRILKLLEMRLDAILLVEEETPIGNRAVLTPMIHQTVKMYWELLRSFVQTRQSLGELPSKPAELKILTPSTRAEPTIEELYAEVQKRLTPPTTIDLEVIDAEVLDTSEE